MCKLTNIFGVEIFLEKKNRTGKEIYQDLTIGKKETKGGEGEASEIAASCALNKSVCKSITSG